MYGQPSFPPYVLGWMIAGVLGGATYAWLLIRARMRPARVAFAIAVVGSALFVGSKVLFLIEYWVSDGVSAAGAGGVLFTERMRIPGGIALAVLVGPPLARLIRYPYLRLADAAAPAAGLVIAGIRTGCFMTGCCFGRPSSVPWAVKYPLLTQAGVWQMKEKLLPHGAVETLPTHPLPLYFVTVGVLMTAGFLAYMPRKRYEGEPFGLFLLAYLWSTWLLEFFRADSHRLTHGFVFFCALVATVGFAVAERRLRRARLTPAPARSVTAA